MKNITIIVFAETIKNNILLIYPFLKILIIWIFFEIEIWIIFKSYKQMHASNNLTIRELPKTKKTTAD